jgi:hypothetical protein
MVVAEVLTGIALVKQATDFIKQNIETAKSIGDIAGEIDNLIKGESEAQKARFKKSGGFSNFDTESVAQEIIDAKLAAEQLREVAVMVDLRFGSGTWAGILAERKKRIEEQKRILAEEKKQRAIERQENIDFFKMIGGVIGLVLIVLSLVAVMIIVMSKPAL